MTLNLRLKPFFPLHFSRLYAVHTRSPCPGPVRAALNWRGSPRWRALIPVLDALPPSAISTPGSKLQQPAQDLLSAAD